MALEKTTEKLDKYLDRLAKGKAKKIKPSHLEAIEKKLKAKEAALTAEIEDASKASKKARLEDKLSLVQEQLERALWLSEQLNTGPEFKQ